MKFGIKDFICRFSETLNEVFVQNEEFLKPRRIYNTGKHGPGTNSIRNQ